MKDNNKNTAITLKSVRYFTIEGQEMFDLTNAVQETIENYLHDNFDEDYELGPVELSAILRALANYTEV